MRRAARLFAAFLIVLSSASAYAGTHRINQAAFARQVHAAFAGRYGGAVVMSASDGCIIAIENPKISATQTHPPGSIFKLVTAYAALQEGISSENIIYRCDGHKTLRGVRLNCSFRNGHGAVRIPQAIAQSCNVTFYDLGTRLGSDRLLHYAKAFGLGQKCATYANPQAVGHIPQPPIHPAGVARLAIGQAKGFEITLLEAAEMTRRIATGGQKNLTPIRKAMRLAVVDGTCKNAALDRVKVAGKTGTPEAKDDSNARSGWFVGYAPYDKPEIVVVVFVNRGHGYDAAAPIAKRIFSAFFEGAH